MRIVIFDCNALCHAAKFSTRALSYKGSATGVIFGFIRTLMTLQENLRGDVITFAWDSDKRVKSYRKEVYPEYKANRTVEDKSEADKILDEIAKPQFNEIREKVLPALGFDNIFMQPRLEADDIIGQLVWQYTVRASQPENYEVVMVTRDGDMFQLLSDRCMMYDPVSKKFTTADGSRSKLTAPCSYSSNAPGKPSLLLSWLPNIRPWSASANWSMGCHWAWNWPPVGQI